MQAAPLSEEILLSPPLRKGDSRLPPGKGGKGIADCSLPDEQQAFLLETINHFCGISRAFFKADSINF